MKRSLWFDVSMLALILVAATIGATLERRSSAPAATAAAQPSAQHSVR
jgi:hypothetical protein